MDEDIAKEARRMIRESVGTTWKPKMRELIGAIAANRKTDWQGACDAAELSLITSSEEIKLEAEKRSAASEESVGWNLAAQAMLDIIADLRAEGENNAPAP